MNTMKNYTQELDSLNEQIEQIQKNIVINEKFVAQHFGPDYEVKDYYERVYLREYPSWTKEERLYWKKFDEKLKLEDLLADLLIKKEELEVIISIELEISAQSNQSSSEKNIFLDEDKLIWKGSKAQLLDFQEKLINSGLIERESGKSLSEIFKVLNSGSEYEEVKNQLSPIIWLGSTVQFVYLLKKLIETDFIPKSHKNGLYSQISKLFIKDDGSKYDSQTLASSANNLKGNIKGKPKNSSKIDDILAYIS